MAIQEHVEQLTFCHISRLTDDRGIFEHASGSHPRFVHGYCTDDNARLLVVAVREKSQSDASIFERIAARFLLDAMMPNGKVHNRMSFDRVWTDQPSTDDCWGRAMWGLGVAVADSANTELRNRCYEAFAIGTQQRSRHLRARCFAALGAVEVLKVDPANEDALGLVLDAAQVLNSLVHGSLQWPWPEERLSYANALIPETMMACGVTLNDAGLTQRGISLLHWLVARETNGEHLSVTPVGGCGYLGQAHGFDQQPIEVAALADAAKRARTITKDEYWDDVLHMAVTWFLGNNDSGVPMIDFTTSGGYDGLEINGVNLNQGAESTLAMLSTMQHRSMLWSDSL
jgi:hypothetical protein